MIGGEMVFPQNWPKTRLLWDLPPVIRESCDLSALAAGLGGCEPGIYSLPCPFTTSSILLSILSPQGLCTDHTHCLKHSLRSGIQSSRPHFSELCAPAAFTTISPTALSDYPALFFFRVSITTSYILSCYLSPLPES